jgi:uncharacterized protein HemY
MEFATPIVDTVLPHHRSNLVRIRAHHLDIDIIIIVIAIVIIIVIVIIHQYHTPIQSAAATSSSTHEWNGGTTSSKFRQHNTNNHTRSRWW